MNSQIRIQVTADTRQALASLKLVQKQIGGLAIAQAKAASAQATTASASKKVAVAMNSQAAAAKKSSASFSALAVNAALVAGRLTDMVLGTGALLPALTASGVATKTLSLRFVEAAAGTKAFALASSVARTALSGISVALAKVGGMSTLRAALTSTASGLVAGAKAAMQFSATLGGALVASAHKAAAALKTVVTPIGKFGSALLSLPAKLSAVGSHMVKFGKNIQWLGRQLEYRLTLPLLALGGIGLKWAMDFEEGITKIRKVYGDLDMTLAEVNEDVDKIAGGLMALSNIYGIHADAVADIAAAYAQAGAQGAALMEVTEATMKMMILGNMTAEEATKGIITLVDSYKLSTTELMGVIDALNIIENQTPLSMQDSITGLQKVGATARAMGVEIVEVAAMLSAMVPAAGSAGEAGNFLKSVMLQIMAPTGQAAALFGVLGTQFKDAAWHSSTLTERLEILAGAWVGLGQEAKAEVARGLAQLKQGNKLITLLDDMTSATSRYHQVLADTGDAEKNALATQRELQMFMTSAPQQWDILTNRMRNALTTVMLPMLPAIIAIMNQLAAWAVAFENLSPATQKIILYVGIFLALLGPLTAYLGTLFQVLGGAIKGFMLFGRGIAFAVKSLGLAVLGVGKFIVAVGSAFVTGFTWLAGIVSSGMGLIGTAFAAFPITTTLAIAAGLIAIGYLFRDSFAGWGDSFGNFMSDFSGNVSKGFSNLWASIAAGLGGLSGIFQRALQAVINVIGRAITIIMDLLSYLNPFATHSPSLVQNVQRGLAVIKAEFRKLTSITSSLNTVASAIRNVGNAIAEAGRKAAAANLAERMELAAKAGLDPAMYQDTLDAITGVESAMDSVQGQIDAANGLIKDHEDALKSLSAEIKAQEAVLRSWELQLEAADAAIDAETEKLDVMKDALSALNSELSEATSRLGAFQSVPIAGTYAFEDAIFANDQETNTLSLQLKLLEQQLTNAGFSISEVRSAQSEYTKAQEDALAVQDQLTDSTDGLTGANDALNGSFDVTGASADDVRRRMALLAGEIEGLRGEQLDLRLQGAGSDVLSGLVTQISQVGDARRSLAGALAEKVASGDTGSGTGTSTGGDTGTGTGGSGYTSNVPIGLFGILDQMDAIQKAIDRSSLEGEILNLQKGLTLDPGNKAISDAFRVPEMSVGAILGGIATERANIASLTAEILAMEDAIAGQEAVIETLNIARDGLQDSYDAEQLKLDALNDQYAEIEASIASVEEVVASLTEKFDELGEARDSAVAVLDEAVALGTDIEQAEEAAASAAAGGSGAGGGGLGTGDFAVPGGGGTGFDSDMSLDEWIEEINRRQDEMFEDLDLGQHIRDWWNDNWAPELLKLKESWNDWWGTWGPGFSDAIDSLWDTISGSGNNFAWVGDMLDGLGGFFSRPLNALYNDIWLPFWTRSTEALANFVGEISGAMGPFLTAMGDIAHVLVVVFGGAWLLVWAILKEIWDGGLEFFFDIVSRMGTAIAGVMLIISGWVMMLKALVTLDFGMLWDSFAMVMNGLWKIVNAVIMSIIELFWTGIKTMGQIIGSFVSVLWEDILGLPSLRGAWDAIVDFFRGIKDWFAGWSWDFNFDLESADGGEGGGGGLAMIAVNAVAVAAALQRFAGWVKSDFWPSLQTVFSRIGTVVGAVFTGIAWAVTNLLLPGLSLFVAFLTADFATVVGTVFGWLLVAGKAAFTAIAWTVTNVLIPAFMLGVGFVQNVLWPVMQTAINGIVTVMQALGTAAVWVWGNIIVPAFGLAVDYVQNVLWPVMKAIFAVISAVIEAYGAVVGWVWENLIQPAFRLMWWYIQNVTWPILKAIFAVISGAFKVLSAVFLWAWENIIKPVFSALWGFVQDHVWPVLEKVFGWIGDKWDDMALGFQIIWNTVLQPALAAVWHFLEDEVWPVVKDIFTQMHENWDNAVSLISTAWTEVLKPALKAFWDFLAIDLWPSIDLIFGWISGAWTTATTAISDAWTNTLKPALKAAWLYVTNILWPEIKGAFGSIMDKWESVATKVQTVWDTILKPALSSVWTWIDENLLSKFDQIGTRLSDAFSTAAGLIEGPMNSISGFVSGGVNAARGTVNTLINGVNRVSEFFGMGRLVEPLASGGTIPTNTYAAGGIPSSEVGAGFTVNRARAIVGEGSKWDEFVIPTDPRYRGRAHALLMDLASRIGMPAEGTTKRFAAGGMLGGPGKLNTAALGATAGALGGVNGLGLGDLISGAVTAVKNGVKYIAKGAVGALWHPIYNLVSSQLEGLDLSTSISKRFARGQGGKLLGRVDEWVNAVDHKIPHYKPAAERAQEAYDEGKGTFTVGTAQAMGGLIHPLARGGIVRGGMGGILAHIGEGRHDEAVVPLDGSFGGEGRTFNFYGDLSFPNIDNPDDVEEFLLNLEAMAD